MDAVGIDTLTAAVGPNLLSLGQSGRQLYFQTGNVSARNVLKMRRGSRRRRT
jgi:hypothetical protein